MKDFNYYAPTEVVFGREAEARTGQLVHKYQGTKVLVHYGGQSAKRSGLLDAVCRSLQEAGIAYVTLGGVVPNPRVAKVREGVELCRKEGFLWHFLQGWWYRTIVDEKIYSFLKKQK